MAERLVDTTARSDAELITAVRVGDTGAYEELYRRHVDAAMAVGRHLTGSRADAEDVVSEAFARVLSALQRGAGPEMAFRPYLLTSVRNAFYDRTRKDKRLDVTDEVPEDLGRVLAAAAASDDDVERKLAITAFASLPERWQLVLWHTEVEGRTPAEVGPLLGLAPNAVAALAYRAREGLRQAYLNAHIQARPPAACAETVPKLGAYVRDDLSNRDRQKVEEHLKGCERCQAIVIELREAGSRLRVALIPIVAGIPVAAYLSGIGAGGLGAFAAWGSRVSSRFKELGPGGQVAATLGAVAAAGVLVVGALAAAQAVTGGGRDQTVAAPDSGGGGGGGSGGGGGGSEGGGGSGAGSGSIPPASPAPTDAPPAATPTVPVTTSALSPGPASPTSPTSPTSPVIPTSPSLPRPRPSTTVPGSTAATAPTTAATTAPTTDPPSSFSVSLGTAGPAYAGLGVTIPVAVGNGAAAAAAAGPGRSAVPTLSGLLPRQAGPTGQPTVTVPLPTGVSFTGVDNASWACTVGAGAVQCVLPVVAPGATSSGLIQLQLAANAPATITLQATVADGANLPVSGSPLVITVQPAPAGVTGLFVDHADLALLGNAVLTCNPTATATCVTARDNPAAAPGQVDKSGQQMIWIDVDADPTTFTSSSATLDLPAGAQVLAAQLVWGGNTQPGAGGVAAPSPSGTGSVLLSPPGAAAAVSVTAASVSTDPTSAARYLATADVTALVAAAGPGTYTAANVQVATGPGAFGGWVLQVVYRDPAAPLRMVALSSQVTTINRGGTASVVLSGLTASSAARNATVSYAAVEGDFGIVPEQVAMNGAALTNAGNPVGNPMNGSVTTSGARSPAFVNNFGFDADQFPAVVAPGQTEVRLDISSSQDRFRVFAVGLSVPL